MVSLWLPHQRLMDTFQFNWIRKSGYSFLNLSAIKMRSTPCLISCCHGNMAWHKMRSAPCLISWCHGSMAWNKMRFAPCLISCHDTNTWVLFISQNFHLTYFITTYSGSSFSQTLTGAQGCQVVSSSSDLWTTLLWHLIRPLFVFSLSDPKQNARSLLTSVSGTVVYALSHGTLSFALHGSFFNHLLIGWKSSTANQSLWNRWLL